MEGRVLGVSSGKVEQLKLLESAGWYRESTKDEHVVNGLGKEQDTLW